MPWTIEFYEDDTGRQPAREWILGLDSAKRASVLAAIEILLTEFGLDICKTEHGKQLGEGLFELRIRHDAGTIQRKAGHAADPDSSESSRRDILLRVFCHAYGDRIVLLLGGYDKGRAPNERRQQKEIAAARKRLRSFRLKRRRRSTGQRRRG